MAMESLKSEFTTAATAFDLQAAVEELYRDHPKRSEMIIVYDADKRHVVHPVQSEVEELTAMMEEDGEFMEIVENACALPVGANFCTLRKFISLKQVSIQASGSFFTMEDFPAEEKYFVFDHEIGHALLHGMCNRLKQECLADTYASIRHFQRFGLESNVLELVINKRASQFSMWDSDNREDYYTIPMIERVIEQKEKLNIMSLTPEETTKLAIDLVKKYQPSRAASADAAETFKQMHQRVKDTQGLSTFAAMAELALTTRNRPVFKPATIILQDILRNPAFQGHEKWDAINRLLQMRVDYVKETGDLKAPFAPVVQPERHPQLQVKM